MSNQQTAREALEIRFLRSRPLSERAELVAAALWPCDGAEACSCEIR